jgi:hypothetical protein
LEDPLAKLQKFYGDSKPQVSKPMYKKAFLLKPSLIVLDITLPARDGIQSQPKKVDYLGYYLTRDGIQPQPKKVGAILLRLSPLTT